MYWCPTFDVGGWGEGWLKKSPRLSEVLGNVAPDINGKSRKDKKSRRLVYFRLSISTFCEPLFSTYLREVRGSRPVRLATSAYVPKRR